MKSKIVFVGLILSIGAFSLSLFSCSQKESPTQLVILSTTDIHGHVFPWDYYADEPQERYSMLKAASLVEELRQTYPNNLLLDAGDWLQGNPFAEFFAKVDTVSAYPLLTVAEKMNYDAIVLGNHEFNFGIELLNKRLDETDVPFLGANIRHSNSGEAAYKPYIIREIDGFKVAVIGLTTPGSAIWDRPRVENRLEFTDGVEAAAYYTETVRGQGAEVIVILAHSGLETGSSYTSETVPVENFGQLIAENIPGVHALILGHSHRVIDDMTLKTDKNPDGVAVTMAGRWASHVGLTELLLSRNEQGEAIVSFGRNEALPVEDFDVHAEIASQIEHEHDRVREFVREPLASTESVWDASDARIYDRPIIHLIHHVQREVTGADISLASVFNPSAHFGPGAISRGDLARIYPYENTLFKKRITGKVLREILEFSARFFEQTEPGEIPQTAGITPGFNYDIAAGVHYEMDFSQPVGNRIKNLRFNDRPVRDDQTFTLAVNSYRAVGGGDYHMIANAEIIREYDQSVRSMMEEFLIERGTIEPEDIFTQYWRILHLP